MANVLHVITVLITASGIVQGSATNSAVPLTMQARGQTTTEMHHSSSTISMSTHSTFRTNSTNRVTSASNETHPTNSTSSETSIHSTTTSSQAHTMSHGMMTSADQTETASVVSKSSETTLRATKLFPLTTKLSPLTTKLSPLTTKFSSLTTILLSTKEPSKTATSKGKVTKTPSSASSNTEEDSLARNPGLVAILCIFFIILAIVIVVAIAKIISSRKTSQFERLEDLPMNKMNEDAPFAQYPSK